MIQFALIALLASPPNPPVYDGAIRMVSPIHMSVTIPEGETAPIEQLEDWAILSQDDPNYAAVQRPAEIAVKAKPISLDKDGGWPFPHVKEYEVILALPFPLVSGTSYLVGSLNSEINAMYTPDFESDWTPTLKVNQVGYLPEAPAKYAYAGYYVGGMTPIEIDDDALGYRVVNAEDGSVAHRGQLNLRYVIGQNTEDAYMEGYSRSNVYDLDLFPVATPGWYYIVWEGVGRSWTFRVAHDVYDEAFITSFRGLYHHRCGTALTEEYTQWTHDECHVAPATASAYARGDEGSAFEELPAQSEGIPLEVKGGYHDAGDYDRHADHLEAVDALVDLYLMFPERHSRDDLGLPESGNDIPDVLDEARWGLGLFAQLQAEDGSVRGGLETTGHPGFDVGAAEDTGTTWYAYAASALSTYKFVRAAARYALAMNDWDRPEARAWLQRAENAWAWAEANRPEEEDSFADAAAAVALFEASGRAQYEASFHTYMPFEDEDLVFAINRWDSDEPVGLLLTYIGIDGASEEHIRASMQVILNRFRYLFEVAQQSSYRLFKHPYAPITNGTYTTPIYAEYLFKLYESMTDEELGPIWEEVNGIMLRPNDYLAWGIHMCGLTLGNNASGLSWTTGLGSRRVERPLHVPSIVDDIEAPVPGITVYGPCATSGCQMHTGIIEAARLGFVPPFAEWPKGESFADVSYVPSFNEYTVSENIVPTTFAFGYLAAMEGGERAGQEGQGGAGGSGGEGGTGGDAGSGGMSAAGGAGGEAGGMAAGGAGGGAAGAGGGTAGTGGDGGGEASSPQTGTDGGGCDCSVSNGSPIDGLMTLMLLTLCGLGRRSWRTNQ